MSESQEKFCARSACTTTGGSHACRIWNQPSRHPGYRTYCIKCSQKILKYNRDCPGDIQLRFEAFEVLTGKILHSENPQADTKTDAEVKG